MNPCCNLTYIRKEWKRIGFANGATSRHKKVKVNEAAHT